MLLQPNLKKLRKSVPSFSRAEPNNHLREIRQIYARDTLMRCESDSLSSLHSTWSCSLGFGIAFDISIPLSVPLSSPPLPQAVPHKLKATEHSAKLNFIINPISFAQVCDCGWNAIYAMTTNEWDPFANFPRIWFHRVTCEVLSLFRCRRTELVCITLPVTSSKQINWNESI